jgi:HEAT repeat protein
VAAVLAALAVTAVTAVRAEENAAGDAADLERRIGALITQLGADEFAARESASKELRTIGFPAFARLRAAVDSKDAETAKRARELIGPYDKILALLDKLPQDWHTTLYYGGMTGTQGELVGFGGAVVPYLAERFKREKEPLYRFNCVTILNAIRTPEALALLRELVKDQHPWTRVESVWALGNAKDTESLPALMHALEKDADENVRKEALIAVAKILGVRLFALLPDGTCAELASNLYLTDEGRNELARVHTYFSEHKTLPDAETIKAGRKVLLAEVGEAESSGALPDADDAKLKGDWKVKTFSAEEGKARWIFVRLDKDPEQDAKPKE